MFKISKNNSQILGVGVSAFVLLGMVFSQPASACRPAPGSVPATLETRVNQTPYVFDGTVTRVNEDTLTIRVNRYFKGKGSRIINLKGFNRTSCDTFITKPGARYLFFAKGTGRKNLDAVYDGAYGSVREWNDETKSELKNLGLIPKNKK
jgi:hypothetical protein